MKVHNAWMEALHRHFAGRYRPRRMQAFVDAFSVTDDTRIVDVGGTPLVWSMVGVRPQITIVNPQEPWPDLPGHIEWLQADGCDLPFPDGHFDIAFSNSVIEHLGTWERQQAFAHEVSRVAPNIYVQTPNFWFPVEPHVLAPIIHWLPKPIRTRLIRYFTLYGLLRKPTPKRVREIMDEYRLLSRRELCALFPDAWIETERIAGLSKSFVVLRHPKRFAFAAVR